MRSLFSFAATLGLVACGSTPPPPPSPATPPPAAAAPPAAPARVAPDTPTGADAARDQELAAQARGILEAYSDREAAFSPDGKKIAFLSARDGLNQVYLSDPQKPEAAPERLVTSSERCASPLFTLDGKAVLFLSDSGLDENFSIFRATLDGQVTELTPGQKLRRSQPIVPDRAGGVMFFTANRGDERELHLYRAATDAPGEPTLLYTDAGPGGLADVSRDGKAALFVRLSSLSESQIFLVDLTKGSAEKLYPAGDAKENVSSALFSADGRRVFVTTDGGGESGLLLALDAKTGKVLSRYTETKPKTASVALGGVASSGDRLNLTVDAGDHQEIRVLDARSLALQGTVALPIGAGGAGPFRLDGKAFPVTWSSAASPPSIFTVDAASRRVTPLRKDARPTLAGLGKIEASITHVRSFDGQEVPVNVYLPASAHTKKLPVIVIVHGGPASASTAAWSPNAVFYGQQGFAVIEPNVRGSTGFGRAYERGDNGKNRLDAVKDMGEVGKWAVAQPWSDGRAIIFGGSYGGYMTLMAVTHQTDQWKAGIDLAGPANLLSFMASTTAEIRSIFIDEFGDPDKDKDFLQSISPIRDIDKVAVPLFVYQGKNDPRVPEAEAGQVVAALRARKVPVEYMLVDNEGHSLEHIENRAMFMARSARFLEKVLRP